MRLRPGAKPTIDAVASLVRAIQRRNTDHLAFVKDLVIDIVGIVL